MKIKFSSIFFSAILVSSSVYLWYSFAINYVHVLGEEQADIDEQGLITDDYDLASSTLAALDFNSLPTDEADSIVQHLIPTAAAANSQAENHIVVGSMKVDSRIWEGKTTRTLNNGIWRIPGTSTPDKGGNTVLAAHRWMLLASSKKSFYDIDKVKIGDKIAIRWNGKDYNYKVTSTQVVTPDKVSILSASKKPKLTLFSCTPLFSTKYRLVVEAELVEPGQVTFSETK